MRSPPQVIMVPLDGSPTSEQALVVGGALARHAGAVLHVVTVKPPISTVYAHGIDGDGTGVERALQEGFTRYLEQQTGLTRGADRAGKVCCAVLDGRPSRALTEYARTHQVDLIVMTTHGWGGLKRLWLGSVADELMRHPPCPLLLMRPSSTAPVIGLHRVLVALQSVESADEILDPTLTVVAMVTGAHFTLLHVLEPQSPLVLRMAGVPARTATNWVREVADAARDRLEHLAQQLRGGGIPADARVVIGRNTADQIVAFARRAGSDLIAVGTRGGHGLERAILGSVADKVVRAASQMVLVVPIGPELTPKPVTRREAATQARPLGAPVTAVAGG